MIPVILCLAPEDRSSHGLSPFPEWDPIDMMAIGETLTYKCDGGQVLINDPSVSEIDVECDEGNMWTDPDGGWHDCIDSKTMYMWIGLSMSYALQDSSHVYIYTM